MPEKQALAESVREREGIEASVTALLDLHRPIEYRPDNGPTIRSASRIVQVDDLDRTRASLLGDWGGGTAQRMGWAPLAILSLSLFSVAGTLVASLRSRSRELGVLRSCGLSRWGLLRLALPESILLGIAAIPISAILGICGASILLEVTSVVGYRLDFAGIRPRFIVPWNWLWPGWIVTAIVCGLAASWAGIRIGRTPPASLLSGR